MITNLPQISSVKLWQGVDHFLAGPNDCWPWILGTRDGYGRIWVGGRKQDTHRVAWELTNGPIPSGLYVLHSCDNPPCCNPAHLFLGTHDDNMADKAAKGRGYRPIGETAPLAKLTSTQAIEMRRLHAEQRLSGAELGRRFGVSDVAALMVISRKTWKHV